MTGERSERLLALIRDLLEELELDLQRLMLDARTDPLTGVFNRRFFDLRLHQEVERVRRYGGRLALVLLDLDDFKVYNDRHGHRRGDDLLAALGRSLSESVREPDVVCRYGGEEFALILPETDEEGAVRLALRLRDRMRRDLGAELTFSAGVAAFPDDARSAVELVEAADRALYQAKGVGKAAVATARGQVVRLLGPVVEPRSAVAATAVREECPSPAGDPAGDLSAVVEALGGLLRSQPAPEPEAESVPEAEAVPAERGEPTLSPARPPAPAAPRVPAEDAAPGRPVGVGFAAGETEPRSLWLGRECIPIRRADRRPDGSYRVGTDLGTFVLRHEGGAWMLYPAADRSET